MIQTKEILLDPKQIDPALADEAGAVLRRGGLVAFPTETVYGLGANALDERAVRSIFTAKGRPSDNPLIVHVAGIDDVAPLVTEIPPRARAVMERFWPGPISIILKKSDKIGDVVSAGLDTVAVRMPSHPVALAVIQAAGVPVAAPSANTSGKPSPTAARHVRDDMYGKIDMIIDGGRCGVGVESTVLDLSGDTPAILRPGGITAQMLVPVIGPVISPAAQVADKDTPKCPGMKYKHYAPEAQVVVLEYTGTLDHARLTAMADSAHASGKRVGVLSCENTGNIYGVELFYYGGGDSRAYAANLFYALRTFDEAGIDIVYCPMRLGDEMAVAVKNRLYKAAAGNVVPFDKGNGA